MANALDQTFATAILNATTDQTGAAVRLTTGPLHVRAMTAVGSATVLGTELPTGSGYTSGAGAPTIIFAAASVGLEASNAALTVVNMPACIIVGVEIWDSAGTPARKWQGPITPVTCALGDTWTIPSGSFTIGLPA